MFANFGSISHGKLPFPHPFPPSSHEMCSFRPPCMNILKHRVVFGSSIHLHSSDPKAKLLFFFSSLHLFYVSSFRHLHDNFPLSHPVFFIILILLLLLLLLLIAVPSERSFFLLLLRLFVLFIFSIVISLSFSHSFVRKQLSFSLNIPFTIVITFGSMYYLCILFWTIELRQRTIQKKKKSKYNRRNDKKYFGWKLDAPLLQIYSVHWFLFFLSFFFFFLTSSNRLVA